MRSLTLAIAVSSAAVLSQSPRPLPSAQFEALGDTLHVPASSFSVRGTVMGDLDGRGANDLLRWGRAGIECCLGLGDGRFGDPIALSGLEANEVAIADVDGDGDQDVLFVTTGLMPTRLRLLRNQGAAVFAADLQAVARTSLRSSASLIVGDVDGDGADDIATVDADRPAILRMDPTGVFRVSALPLANVWAPRLLVDVDRDGDLDWIHLDAQSQRIAVLLNGGAGTFARGSTVDLGPVGVVGGVFLAGPGSSSAGLVVSTQTQTGLGFRNSLTLLTGDGNGGFAIAGSLGDLPAAARSVRVSDLDRDGRQEFVVNMHGAQSRIYEPFLTSLLDVTASHIAPERALFAVELPDLDGDGDPDLVGVRADESVDAYLNDGAGRMQPLRRPQVASVPLVRHTARFDVDRDGSMDVVFANGDVVRTGRPEGVQVELARFAGVDGRHIVPLIGDLNADGASDLLFLGDDPLAFDGVTQLPIAGIPQPDNPVVAGVIADFAGDAQPDVLVFLQSGLDLWLGGAGRPYAAQPAGGPVATTVRRALTQDLDLDGDMDVICGGSAGVIALANDGRGSFSDASATVFAGSPGALVHAMTKADLDGNGLDEILVAAGSDLEIWSYGVGSYQLTVVPVATAASWDLAASDIDLDGDVDVVLLTVDGLRLLINDGAGVLTPAGSRRTGSLRELGLAMVDVDGDGDEDVFAGTVYHNTHRHLRVPFRPTLGGALDVDLWAAPTYGATTFVGTLVATEVLTIPGLTLGGVPLWVNPNSAVILPLAAVNGTLVQQLAVPNSAALAGQPFAAQAVFFGARDLRLSNLATGFVLR